jgi:hypothetical protein
MVLRSLLCCFLFVSLCSASSFIGQDDEDNLIIDASSKNVSILTQALNVNGEDLLLSLHSLSTQLFLLDSDLTERVQNAQSRLNSNTAVQGQLSAALVDIQLSLANTASSDSVVSKDEYSFMTAGFQGDLSALQSSLSSVSQQVANFDGRIKNVEFSMMASGVMMESISASVASIEFSLSVPQEPTFSQLEFSLMRSNLQASMSAMQVSFQQQLVQQAAQFNASIASLNSHLSSTTLCPPNSLGTSVSRGCTCNLETGFQGTIEPKSTTPFYSGFCYKWDTVDVSNGTVGILNVGVLGRTSSPSTMCVSVVNGTATLRSCLACPGDSCKWKFVRNADDSFQILYVPTLESESVSGLYAPLAEFGLATLSSSPSDWILDAASGGAYTIVLQNSMSVCSGNSTCVLNLEGGNFDEGTHINVADNETPVVWGLLFFEM